MWWKKLSWKLAHRKSTRISMSRQFKASWKQLQKALSETLRIGSCRRNPLCPDTHLWGALGFEGGSNNQMSPKSLRERWQNAGWSGWEILLLWANLEHLSQRKLSHLSPQPSSKLQQHRKTNKRSVRSDSIAWKLVSEKDSLSFLTLRVGMMLKAGKGVSKVVFLVGSGKMARRNSLSTQASLYLVLNLTDTALLCCTSPNTNL